MMPNSRPSRAQMKWKSCDVSSAFVSAVRYLYAANMKPFVGHGGALVESKLFDRRVVGSNHTLATT